MAKPESADQPPPPPPPTPDEVVLGLPIKPGGTVEICGATTDYIDVQKFKQKGEVKESFVQAFSPAVVLLQWQSDNQMRAKLAGFKPGDVQDVRWCTGTLISPTQVITAAHCFEPAPKSSGYTSPYKIEGDKVVYPTPQQAAAAMNLVFGYERNKATNAVVTGSTFPIVELQDHGSTKAGDHDFAIVRFAPGASKLPSPTRIGGANPSTGETLAIIQHPGGVPKMIDVGTLLETTEAQADQPNRDRLIYNNIDTIGGSSGSGVLDAKGVLRGVHVAGGCEKYRGNQAVGIKWIIEASPIVKKLAEKP